MRRLCERPGCSGPASVSYGMDADERLVWIDSDPAVDPARAGALCRRHADALRPPRGWTLDDRRDDVPRLLRVPENPVAEPERRPATQRQPRRRPVTENSPDLFEDGPQTSADGSAAPSAPAEAPAEIPVEIRTETRIGIPHEITAGSDGVSDAESEVPSSVEPVVDAPSPDETRAIPWVPRLGNGTNQDGPRGRLLDRAFGRRAPEQE